MKSLKYCSISWTPNGCETVYPDGTRIGSFPHYLPHYYVISHRSGYGDDVLEYCREHDFFHSFCAEYFDDRASPVLWSLAHGAEIESSVSEELLVQTCQRWVRASERPIIGGVDWDEFKRRAIERLAEGDGPMPIEKAMTNIPDRGFTDRDRDELVTRCWFYWRSDGVGPAELVECLHYYMRLYEINEKYSSFDHRVPSRELVEAL